MKVGVLTGGGDAPGLNAVIRAVLKRAEQYGIEVVGIRYGWAGLLKMDTVPLHYSDLENKIGEAGTVIKTSRTNPVKDEETMNKCIENFKKLGLDALIAIGGDDTLTAAKKLHEAGLKVIGVPKTIDNDLKGTDYTFGFDTAVNAAMEAIESLKTTGEAMDRIMVVEIMGRHAGWIALYSGIAAGADLILIPEEPFKISDVVEFVKKKKAEGKGSLTIVVAEGALIADYKGPITKDTKVDQFGHVYLGGIGEFLAKEIEKATGFETRAVAPAHIVRGMPPTAFDRVLATRLGYAAVELVRKGIFGKMVALRGTEIVSVDLSEAVAETKLVDSSLIELKNALTS
ncbi:MAG: ATP-dependent 6-phosphofructokinase [Thermoproteota archaeon]|nr:6-phosphofructokinase [Candidatus Brockarchaeota archaeon]